MPQHPSAVEGRENQFVGDRENQWTPNRENTTWTLHMWPFYLVITYNKREALPYQGSLVGKLVTLREIHSWATPETASVGMIQWALQELSKSYHELAKLVAPPQQGGSSSQST